MAKLLFIYLCDNCDIAGFIELNQKRWASDMGTDIRTIEGARQGLGRGLIYSNTKDCIYIKNFLKHQKNLPLNEKNNAHLGIIKRFGLYSLKFSIQNINEFIKGAGEGLASPTGNGNGNGNGKERPEKKFNYIEFYEAELLKTEDENYHRFVKWLLGENEIGEPFVKCLSLKNQIGHKQFLNLRQVAEKHGTLLVEKIKTLENRFDQYKPTSLSLTLNVWLKKKY
jgi:hypothetical protein